MTSTVEPRVDPAIGASRPAGAASRLVSLDAFRGLTMLFMASEMMRIPSLARAFPDNGFVRALAGNLDHRPWVGMAPWDLIQPAFMFMVGVALPFSVASRRARGQSFQRMLGHSVFRALVLIALGIFLRSQGRPQTYFTFEDVLTQIGLGYVPLFLLAWARPAAQWAAAAAILAGYWAAFALYPLPAAGFDPASVGVPADWPHRLGGFAQHWAKNTNLAQAFDVWFLNLFPRERPFLFNRGGYLTLNFVPSLATMIFGLLAGGWLRTRTMSRESPVTRPQPAAVLASVRPLLIFGAAGILAGAALHALGICPIVKRIWTPSWTLFSAGWVVLLLAAFYAVIDLRGSRRWTMPLVVVGMNSIAMYVLVHVAHEYVERSLTIHFGGALSKVPAPFLPLLLGGITLAVFWLMLYWMYQRRVFVRI